MKKIQKVLVGQVGVDVAPVWFAPAMEKAMEKFVTKEDVQNVVPAWFEPAMEKVVAPLATKNEVSKLATKDELASAVSKLATKDELASAVSKLATKDELASAVSKLATKDDLLRFYTKEDISSSFRTIIDMLGECATKDDMKKMNLRLDKTIMTLSNHETRIITLEGSLPTRVEVGLR